jgi:hypothetical protein
MGLVDRDWGILWRTALIRFAKGNSIASRIEKYDECRYHWG